AEASQSSIPGCGRRDDSSRARHALRCRRASDGYRAHVPGAAGNAVRPSRAVPRDFSWRRADMKKSNRARRMERHHARMSRGAGLNLVSLMDIFTMLVFFLLVNSAEVQ